MARERVEKKKVPTTREAFKYYTPDKLLKVVKRRAKQIKKSGEFGVTIQHHTCLDFAAVEAGFHNYADLVNCCKNEGLDDPDNRG